MNKELLTKMLITVVGDFTIEEIFEMLNEEEFDVDNISNDEYVIEKDDWNYIIIDFEFDDEPWISEFLGEEQ